MQFPNSEEMTNRTAEIPFEMEQPIKSPLYAKELKEYLLETYFHKLNGTEQDMNDFMLFLNYIKDSIPPMNLTTSGTQGVPLQEELSYCNFQMVPYTYRRWHWHLSVSVAIIGSITNVLTILILTKKSMFSSTNLILLGIAIADLLVSSEYVPYGMSRFIGGSTLRYSKSYAFYILVRAHFSQVCHTIAIWLTAVLALWRWISVCRPHQAPTKCSHQNAKRALIATYFLCPAVASPTFWLYSVKEKMDGGTLIYVVNFSSLVVESETVWNVIFFLYSAVVKILPCLFLIILIPAIIKGMLEAARRRVLLRSGGGAAGEGGSQKIAKNKNSFDNSFSSLNPKSKLKKSEIATERTTKMLVVILFIFLVAEVPQGVLTGLAIIYGQEFFINCYLPLSDVMDLLALCNASVNFVVYCFMSQDFRAAFLEMLSCCKVFKTLSKRSRCRKLPVSHTTEVRSI